eukprot:Anaeramoba_ignava/a348173_15.p1 GENE.a348173_15~~a348173_15.p1  ORF type:complete len:313 (-),score=31.69 a348173_15:162-1100(-)
MRLIILIIPIIALSILPLNSCSSENKPLDDKVQADNNEEMNTDNSEKLQNLDLVYNDKAEVPNDSLAKEIDKSVLVNGPGRDELFTLMNDMAQWLLTPESQAYFIEQFKKGDKVNEVMKKRILELGKPLGFRSLNHIDTVSALFETEAEYDRLDKEVDKNVGIRLTAIANEMRKENPNMSPEDFANITNDETQAVTAQPGSDEEPQSLGQYSEDEKERTLAAMQGTVTWMESKAFEKEFMNKVKNSEDQEAVELILQQKIPELVYAHGFKSMNEYRKALTKYSFDKEFKAKANELEERSYSRINALFKKLKK